MIARQKQAPWSSKGEVGREDIWFRGDVMERQEGELGQEWGRFSSWRRGAGS